MKPTKKITQKATEEIMKMKEQDTEGGREYDKERPQDVREREEGDVEGLRSTHEL